MAGVWGFVCLRLCFISDADVKTKMVRTRSSASQDAKEIPTDDNKNAVETQQVTVPAVTPQLTILRFAVVMLIVAVIFSFVMLNHILEKTQSWDVLTSAFQKMRL